MAFNVAPEIFGQLKSGLQFVVTVNQKRYAISLDGVEAATQRARECVRQYADTTKRQLERQLQRAGVGRVALDVCYVVGRRAVSSAGDGDPGPAGAARL